MNNFKSFLSVFNSFSMFVLACGFLYFGYGFLSAAKVVPEILIYLKQEEAGSILTEVKETRKTFDKALIEIKEVIKLIPPALKTVNNATVVVEEITKQSQIISQKTIPDVLKESKELRILLPGIMKSGEQIVKEARHGVKDAEKVTSKATTGVLTGIIKAPFSILSSIGSGVTGLFDKKIKSLSKEDQDLMSSALEKVLSSEKIGYSEKWKSAKSNKSGIVTLERINVDSKCKYLYIQLDEKGKKATSHKPKLCLDKNGTWVPK
jgi:surface antigen